MYCSVPDGAIEKNKTKQKNNKKQKPGVSKNCCHALISFKYVFLSLFLPSPLWYFWVKSWSLGIGLFPWFCCGWVPPMGTMGLFSFCFFLLESKALMFVLRSCHPETGVVVWASLFCFFQITLESVGLWGGVGGSWVLCRRRGALWKSQSVALGRVF